MLTTIRILKPSFVVGENVAGLVSMDNGKTLDAILADLEDEGYQVESFIIPACAIGAWHRRDRIWIVAYSTSNGISRQDRESNDVERTGQTTNDKRIRGQQQAVQYEGLDDLSWDASDTECNGCEDGHQEARGEEQQSKQGRMCESKGASNKSDVTESISQRGCSGDTEREYAEDVRQQPGSPQHGYWDSEPSVGRVANGIPNRVDRLKGLGNAIVPQIAFQLFKAIEKLNNCKDEL